MPQYVWLVVVTISLFEGAAHADEGQCKVNGGGSQTLRSCMQTECEAVKACKTKADAAVATSNKMGGDLKQKYANGEQINSSAGDSSAVQSGTSQLLQGALAECATQKGKCEEKCKPEKAEKKEKQQTQDTLDKCKKEIAAIETQLGKGKTDADQASKGSDDSKKESGGQPPQMPQNDGKDKDKDDDKSTPSTASPAPSATPSPSPSPSPSSETQSTGSTSQPLTPTAGVSPVTNCSGTDFKSSCLDQYQSTCLNSTSETCAQFNNRYCGVSGGMEGADDIKAGSGAGSGYCTTKTAQAYCNVGGRDSCDSCRKLKGLAPLAPEQQASACGIDPKNLPTLQKTGSANALGGASMGASDGSGAMGSGAGQPGAAGPVTAVKENPYDKLNGAMHLSSEGGGGGGGGNGGGGGEASPDTTLADLASGYGIIGRTPSSGGGAAADAQTASLTAAGIAVGGPRVFQLVEDVYRARCAAKKYDNCPPRP